MTIKADLPRQNSDLASGAPASREWYNFFRRLKEQVDSISSQESGSSSSTTTIYQNRPEVTQVEPTTARTLSSGDANTVIECTNAAAVTITVPTSASSFIPLDETIYIIQGGAGQVTVSPAVGVTIDYSDSLKTRTTESTIGLKQIQVDKWQLFGDTEPVAPALSALVRSANSVGAPDFLTASSDGQVLKRESGALVWGSVPAPLPLDTTLTYNVDDTLDVVTTASGTKTMGYSMGKLVSITGTGAYPSKTFSYTGDLLTGIDVL